MAAKSTKGKVWLKATKKFFLLLLNILFYILVIMCGIRFTRTAYNVSYQIFGSVSVESEPGTDVMITIKDGESSVHLAEVLKENDIILNKASFLIREKLMVNNDNPILSGVYQLNTSMDYKEIIDTITDSDANLASEDS